MHLLVESGHYKLVYIFIYNILFAKAKNSRKIIVNIRDFKAVLKN